MDTNNLDVKSETIKRKGIHKFFHVSLWDTYISVLGAIIFLFIAGLQVIGWEISLITWAEALQIGILLGIFGIVARIYYHFFEERYDK
ncbi:MAG: hypothetical protein HQ510_03170 [Candidatus Marinimicrobia bacterium]|nr:hypothetical protein [Candidatus Neomarinimicrobiota bacterium]